MYCFGLLHHSYANDRQLYIMIKKQDCFADKLYDIDQSMSDEVCKISVFVISRLDHCYVLLCGLPKKALHVLQIVQNYAFCLILWFGKIKHLLYYPHWIPVDCVLITKCCFILKKHFMIMCHSTFVRL